MKILSDLEKKIQKVMMTSYGMTAMTLMEINLMGICTRKPSEERVPLHE
jgi:soluble P-type ATPase